MLHIILTVLKITGILLLALILLVIGLMAAVLFVPLRYRLVAVHTGEDTHGEARITWLLHLVSVRLVLRLPAEKDSGPPQNALQVSFRIFGISPQKATAFFKNRKKQSAEKKKKKTARTGHVKKKKKTEPAKTGRVKEERKPDSAQGKKADSGERPASSLGGKADSGERPAFAQNERIKEDKNSAPAQKDRFFTGILNKIRSFGSTIRKIPKRFQQLKNSVLRAVQKPVELAYRLADFRQKLERYDAAETVKEVWKRFRQLLRHFRVRKGKGYLRFGTGDPAMTGELTGLLYMILPVSCREIKVEPQFTDTMLEMELTAAGHIRLIHLASSALWAFRNRKLRRLIRVFRS
ncbi:MAG: DUF2953 domain-containing protein [Lachnospiraceae bacterium]|nr:DUF2953 domain-containing protein [Lachnospiraceae bacterium]